MNSISYGIKSFTVRGPTQEISRKIIENYKLFELGNLEGNCCYRGKSCSSPQVCYEYHSLLVCPECFSEFDINSSITDLNSIEIHKKQSEIHLWIDSSGIVVTTADLIENTRSWFKKKQYRIILMFISDIFPCSNYIVILEFLKTISS